MAERPSAGRVWLGLSPSAIVREGFYLEIPTEIIRRNCKYPVKYLRYLAWSILCLEGSIMLEGTTSPVSDDSELLDYGIYSFRPDGVADWFKMLVDLEVIQRRSQTYSGNTRIRGKFTKNLLLRDTFCIFTDATIEFCHGIHIIPFARGSEWLNLIVEHRRTNDSQKMGEPDDINDVRNGFLLRCDLHGVFDARSLVVLKTPNKVLEIEDIPHSSRTVRRDNQAHPQDERYTAQWISCEEDYLEHFANNTDAAFQKNTPKGNLPSPLLLDYNYGAAAVKQLGRNQETLAIVPFPRPVHVEATKSASTPTREGSEYNEDGEMPKEKMDAEGMVLMFWLNAPGVRERWEKEDAEKRAGIQQWAQGISM